MENFLLYQKHLAMSGIIAQKLSQNSRRFNFNLKNSTVIAVASLGAILTIKLLDEVQTFEEYTDTIHIIIFMIGIIIFYTYIVWKTPELFAFVNRLEDSIKKSK